MKREGRYGTEKQRENGLGWKREGGREEGNRKGIWVRKERVEWNME